MRLACVVNPVMIAVNRASTPWLIVTWHAPPYHNYNTQ